MSDRFLGTISCGAGILWAAVAVIGALTVAAGVSGCADPQPRPSGGTNPDGKLAARRSATEQNAACCLCHVAFARERLTMTHVKRRIACTDCHGPSNSHSMDDTGNTPPDVVFKPAEVNPFCLRCHKEHPLKTNAVAQVRESNGPLRCTSCHGNRHHLPRPTTRP